MTLLTDRDLLIIEPAVFTHAGVAATLVLSVRDGITTGDVLTSDEAGFAAKQINAANVVVVNGVALEIVSQDSDTQLTVSLPRASNDEQHIHPEAGVDLEIQVLSFARLAQQVQIQTLVALGIDPHHPEQPLDESAILNQDAIANVIALRTIAEAFATAAAADVTNAGLAAQALLYARRATHAANATACVLDLNADGQPDATRRLNTIHLVRH